MTEYTEPTRFLTYPTMTLEKGVTLGFVVGPDQFGGHRLAVTSEPAVKGTRVGFVPYVPEQVQR